MRSLVIVILFFLPCLVFAGEPAYVFIIDDNSNPLQGYKILETQRNNIYITKIEPIKKWLTNVRSSLVVVQNGYVYPVKDSIILDKRKGIALLLIDSAPKPLYFNPEEILIDKDVKVLIENKKVILSKVKTLFPSETSRDYLALAEHYENNAEWSRALSIYEEILKQKREDKIIKKIGTIYYRLGNFKKAKEYFEMLPRNEETIIKLVGIYIIEKNFKGALKIINSSGLNSPYLHYLKGVIYYLTNKKDEAYKEVSELSHMDSNLAQNLRDLLR